MSMKVITNVNTPYSILENMKQQQILIIHGGSSFDSYGSYRQDLADKQLDYERLLPKKRWSSWIAEQLPQADVLTPSFPNSSNAQYDEWKEYFEKVLAFLTSDDVRLVGHSLGAMFLAKYLQDNQLPCKVRQIVLAAPCYDDDSNEELGSFSVSSAVNVAKSSDDVHLLHSRDDFVVPFAELAKFQRDLPSATVHVYEDKGHFLDETFPELLEILKQK